MLTSKFTVAVLSAIALTTATACQSPNQADQGTNQNNQAAQPTAVPQADQNTNQLTDQQFVNQAAEAGLAEVQLGNVAVQRATSNDVKQYARRMVQEHTQANNQLKQLATQKNLTIPQSLNPKHQAAKTTLSQLSGNAFDRAYMTQMQQDHAQVVALFRQQAEQGQDANLKNWAATTLPKLQEHETAAQEIANRIGNTSQR